MKVFFNASVRGRKLYLDNYQRIYQVLLSSGYQTSTVAFEKDEIKIAKETEVEAEEFYRRLDSIIKRAEVGIFEVSYPSIGIGYEISKFVSKGKPITALYVKGQIPYILNSIESDKLQVAEYSLDDVEDVIKSACEIMQHQLETRFTMLMQAELLQYLDEIAEEGQARSEYIRKLIYKDKNKRGK